MNYAIDNHIFNFIPYITLLHSEQLFHDHMICIIIEQFFTVHQFDVWNETENIVVDGIVHVCPRG